MVAEALHDLIAESAALRALVADLDEHGWATATPAPGWAVRDQVTHLAHFDDAAVLSATAPGAFRDRYRTADPDAVAAAHRGLAGPRVLDWFDGSRAALIEVFRALPARRRVPWFGPDMSAASALTARLMETWAHGQDVADALGVTREPTARLRDVARIGVATRAFSLALHGLPAPTAPVRVELREPDGGVWSWGPAGVPDRVVGPALDFCLVVTRRRHPADTALAVSGPEATRWMAVAQAFAGGPGPDPRRVPAAGDGRFPRPR